MKLNILSDLHLGLGGLAPPDNDADVVILAGDIARPAEAVAWATSLRKPVLYVPGNHEFYGNSIDATLAALRSLCDGTTVNLLDDDELVLDGVRFVGSTLWTDFLLFGTERRAAAMQEGRRFLRDFARIRTGEAADAIYTPADSAARLPCTGASWRRGSQRPSPAPPSSSRTTRRRRAASIRGSRIRC